MAIHSNGSVSSGALHALVIADLLRAQRALPYEPNRAALCLDGALHSLLTSVTSQESSHAALLRPITDRNRPPAAIC